MASVDMTAVNEVIDKYVGDTLDTYVLLTVKEAAKAKAEEEGASAVDIADAVFDILNDKFSGDVVMAVASQQMCPKYLLPIIRNDIIAALKE